MKIAVTGKGGVGKTTLSATLARLYANEGRSVIAVDADPASNLASALGFPPELINELTPISALKGVIEERIAEAPAKFVDGELRITPNVVDFPAKYSVAQDGVSLIKMGTIPEGGGGCACGINSALRALLHHLILEQDDVLIMDMVAGVEHLGRGTADSVDAMVVVVEPGRASLELAPKIKKLAADLGMERVYAVANRVRSEVEHEFIARKLTERPNAMPLIGVIRYDEDIVLADMEGQTPYDAGLPLVDEVRAIKAALEERVPARA